jgi:nucleoid DNA-binding protein
MTFEELLNSLALQHDLSDTEAKAIVRDVLTNTTLLLKAGNWLHLPKLGHVRLVGGKLTLSEGTN